MGSATSPVSSIGFTASDAGLPDGLDRCLSLIKDVGGEHAELPLYRLFAIIGGRLVPERMRQIERVLVRHDDLPRVVHAPLALNFMDEVHAPMHRAVGEAAIAFCAAVGAPLLVIHPGWFPEARLRPDLQRLLAVERDALSRMAEVAAAQGVTLALENMPVVPETLKGEAACYASDTGLLRMQIEAVNHPNLCATMDVSHAAVACGHYGWDFRSALEAMAPVTGHLHVHDSFGVSPTLGSLAGYADYVTFGQGDTHLPLGWGGIDWEQAMGGLGLRPGTRMTLELHGPFATAETMADSLARARVIATRLTGLTLVA